MRPEPLSECTTVIVESLISGTHVPGTDRPPVNSTLPTGGVNFAGATTGSTMRNAPGAVANQGSKTTLADTVCPPLGPAASSHQLYRASTFARVVALTPPELPVTLL